MAIAFDAASAAGNVSTSTSPLTFSHTCSGTNRILFVEAGQRNASTVSGITYNGVAMTQIGTVLHPPLTTSDGNYLYYLINPATGAHNVSIAYGGGADLRGSSVSYTGAKQSGVPDQSTTLTGSATSNSMSLTLGANSWSIMCIGMDGGTATAGTNSTYRTDNVGITEFFDSNGANTGSFTMSFTAPGGGTSYSGFMVSILPAVTATNSDFLAFM